MTKFRSILFIVTLLVGWSEVAQAEGQAQKEFSPSVYLFHLYYDNGQLFADRDFEFKYDILVEKYRPEIVNEAHAYRGEIVDFKNQVRETFRFDPQLSMNKGRGEKLLVKGKISAKGPFLADGKEVNFYNVEKEKLLTISLSGTSFCNDDGICNGEVGEDEKNCPADCAVFTPSPSDLPSPSPTPTEWFVYFQGKMRIAALSVGMALVLLVLSIWLVRRWLKKKNDLPPPTIQ